MTEKEVDVVAEELARLGGSCWHPGRGDDPVLRVVTERFRERARAAIAALDRFRGRLGDARNGERCAAPSASTTAERLRVGATVIYRPPGDRRAYACVVDQVRQGYIHLVPQIPGEDGWVRHSDIMTEDVVKNLEDQGLIAVSPLGALSPASSNR